MANRLSVAMTAETDEQLQAHLLRADGQEDLCFATYKHSTGRTRRTALLRQIVLPQPGERSVHGNASFSGDFVLRAANEAAMRGEGVAFLHSHPRGRGRQGMSGPDEDAERSYAHLVHAIT
jgi:molybdopterin-synthase adenylyltransferase